MNNDSNQDNLKSLISTLNELRINFGQFSVRLGTVEELLKGSVDKRELRAENQGAMREEIRTIKQRLTNLESADKHLNDRFFQVWIGIVFSLLGALINFLSSRK